MTHSDIKRKICYGWDPCYSNFFIIIEDSNKKYYYNPLIEGYEDHELLNKEDFLDILANYKVRPWHLELIDAGIPF